MTIPRSLVSASVLVLTNIACDDPQAPLPPPPPVAASVLAEGAAMIGGANGMAFDAADRLYVANGAGQSISIIDPDSGEILDALGLEHGVGFPDDLVFTTDGTLYWTDALAGQVKGWTNRGESLTVAEGIPSINPIAASEDGRLFVGQCFHEAPGGIFEVDPSGTEAPSLVLGGVPACASNGMDWRDGSLFTPRWFEGSISRVDTEDGTVSEVTSGWSVPAAVAFDSAGRLHAISHSTGEVVRIDEESGDRIVLATLLPGLDNLAFDSSDRLFVSSTTDAFVVEVLPDGSTRTVSPGGMTLPMGIAVMGDTLYVGEGLTVRSFDKNTGEPLEVIRSVVSVSPLPLFAGPLEVWDDRLLVLDPFFGSAALLDPATLETQNLAAFAAPVDAEPFGGGIAVTELATGNVVLVTGTDLSLRETLASGLTAPAGLAARGDDLYLSDSVTGEVLQIVAAGAVLAPPVPVTDTLFASPEGLAVLGEDQLLVVEGGTGMLHAIDLATGGSTVLADDLPFKPTAPGLPPHMNFNDLHPDASGALYLNADAAASIYKIE